MFTYKNAQSDYHELIGESQEYEGKEYLMVKDYMLDKVLDTINETIVIIKLDDTKILILADNNLLDVILICDINDVRYHRLC